MDISALLTPVSRKRTYNEMEQKVPSLTPSTPYTPWPLISKRLKEADLEKRLDKALFATSVSESANLMLSSPGSSCSSSPMGFTTNVKAMRTFCVLCKDFTNRENTKSQGPQRHVLQNHANCPIYQCSLCPYYSVYDKHHVKHHAERRHRDENWHVISRIEEFTPVIESWYKKCFPHVAFRSARRVSKGTVTLAQLQRSTDTPTSTRSSTLSDSLYSLQSSDVSSPSGLLSCLLTPPSSRPSPHPFSIASILNID